MIVRPRPGILKLFIIMRGSIVPRILPQILGFAVYGALVVALSEMAELDLGGVTIGPFALLAVTLSIFLGFRNGAAYERWWEGRKLWGQLVYEIRNLARAAEALTPGLRRDTLMNALAFCHFLRGGLRRVDAVDEARRFAGPEAAAMAATASPADAALRAINSRLAPLVSSGELPLIAYRILDERLSSLSALQAGCERIATTPLPFAYTLLLHRSIYMVCLLLPFGLVSMTGWATPLITALVAYSFFGLDALAEELEDPFGTEANDLALDALCRVCEISVMESLGETPPAQLEPHAYYLS